jgi:hypothetical protein
MDNGDIAEHLLDPDCQQRQDLWQCIKLVAPTLEKKKWKSKDAISAYCLQCQKVINYTICTSKQVSRHMQMYHSEKLAVKKK